MLVTITFIHFQLPALLEDLELNIALIIFIHIKLSILQEDLDPNTT